MDPQGLQGLSGDGGKLISLVAPPCAPAWLAVNVSIIWGTFQIQILRPHPNLISIYRVDLGSILNAPLHTPTLVLIAGVSVWRQDQGLEEESPNHPMTDSQGSLLCFSNYLHPTRV